MYKIDQFFTQPAAFLMIAGPCAIESKEMLEEILRSNANLNIIRGGLYKMRTSAQTFQGLGDIGIEYIKELKAKYSFQFITEVTDPRQLEKLAPVVDIFQVGSRNMYNGALLKEINNYNRPVVLKRAFSATLAEWLGACEYMPDLGENKIILCERGIRTFETTTRNTLDINSVVYLKQNTKYKVIVDPSHASGNPQMIDPLCKIALASGADGVMIEVHPNPSSALSDAHQQITIEEFTKIKQELIKLAPAFNREIF